MACMGEEGGGVGVQSEVVGCGARWGFVRGGRLQWVFLRGGRLLLNSARRSGQVVSAEYDVRAPSTQQ
jgi:hypothetical protein